MEPITPFYGWGLATNVPDNNKPKMGFRRFSLELKIVAQLQRLAIASTQCMDQTVLLTPDQQHYLYRVLRLKGGDRFIAIVEKSPGTPNLWWLAQLQFTPAEAELLEPLSIQTELAHPLTLVAAMPKGTGFDEVVRAVTELGVTTLVPLLSDRTLVNPSDHKLERWRRIATEAAEQSCRQCIPEIHAPQSFAQALSLAQSDRFAGQQPVICVTDPAAPNLLETITTQPPMGILIMVGPEGGWTPTEQTQAIAQGFTPISLGQRILRSVTASIAVVSVLSTHLDRDLDPSSRY